MKPIYVSKQTFEELRIAICQDATKGRVNERSIELLHPFLIQVKEDMQLNLIPQESLDPNVHHIIRERLFPFYIKVCDKHPKLYTLTDDRMKKGVARFQECLSKTNGDYRKAERLMAAAIEALAASDFHMGRKPYKVKYNDWSNNLFKSAEKLEQWLEKA